MRIQKKQWRGSENYNALCDRKIADQKAVPETGSFFLASFALLYIPFYRIIKGVKIKRSSSQCITETVEKLLAFIRKSPTAFHAVDTMKTRLSQEGFQELSEKEYWSLTPGGRYMVTRNNSALIAFCIPENPPMSFHIMASHSDSPSFKIKENPEITVEKAYVKLNVEKYGGMLMAPWFDRPLSVAGRVVIKENGRFVERLVNIDRDLVLIPNLAVHMNREVNSGYSYNPQKDLLPLYGTAGTEITLGKLVAQAAGVKEEEILSHDLFLYNRMEGSVWGAEREFVSAGRLDDLQCAFASMEGFLKGTKKESIAVHCVLDNEEVGSTTRQGAASGFLKDTLIRINKGLEEPMKNI